jgi:transcriptional regulator with XRE-family HTH domain
MLIMADTALKRIRQQLNVTQENVLRRTKTVSLSTLKNAESGKRVNRANAEQIRDAINSFLREDNQPERTIEELGIVVY